LLAALDKAWAILPFIVVAKELAFVVVILNPGGKISLPCTVKPPVAVAVAFAVPPSIAVEVAVALAAAVGAPPNLEPGAVA
jgi:hypothetical protein